MNFIAYCELPENEAWITQMMWKMKSETGFDEEALVEAVYAQSDVDDVLLDAGYMDDEDYAAFFASWYDELDDSQDGPYPRSGAI